MRSSNADARMNSLNFVFVKSDSADGRNINDANWVYFTIDYSNSRLDIKSHYSGSFKNTCFIQRNSLLSRMFTIERNCSLLDLCIKARCFSSNASSVQNDVSSNFVFRVHFGEYNKQQNFRNFLYSGICSISQQFLDMYKCFI